MIHTGYSVPGYGSMISDSPRMDAYVSALRGVINSDSVVLDIGTGTGIFAMLACKMGCRHVFALEPDNAIQIGRDSAIANGFADRITFIQKRSDQITLPEKANVLISDLSGNLPLFQHHIPAIIDARERLLVEGAIQIAKQDQLMAVPVEVPVLYSNRVVSPWDDKNYGLDLQSAKKLSVNLPSSVLSWPEKITAESYFSAPKRWATLDYTTIQTPDVKAEINWVAERTGTCHGIITWFDRMVDNHNFITNAPHIFSVDRPDGVYGSLFFPLQQPIILNAGDSVSVAIEANLIGDDYVWRWESRVLDADNQQTKARFRQSSFLGGALTLADLERREAGYIPKQSENAIVELFILSRINDELTLGDIANQLITQFPTRFTDWRDALTFSSEVCERHVC